MYGETFYGRHTAQHQTLGHYIVTNPSTASAETASAKM